MNKIDDFFLLRSLNKPVDVKMPFCDFLAGRACWSTLPEDWLGCVLFGKVYGDKEIPDGTHRIIASPIDEIWHGVATLKNGQKWWLGTCGLGAIIEKVASIKEDADDFL